MKACSTKDCPHGAKVAPKLCVPAMNWAIEAHQPLSSIIGIPLGESCFAELKVSDFLGRFDVDGKNNLRECFKVLTRGKQPPDFDRAWFTKVSLASKEYKTFLTQVEDKRKQRTIH